MKLSTRIWILILSAIIGLVVLSSFALIELNQLMMNERRGQLSTIVELAHASLSKIHAREKDGELSREEAQKLADMPHRRAITKKEQADMGKLKKSVRGLVIVHPMTELGREMGLKEMTGFSKTAF